MSAPVPAQDAVGTPGGAPAQAPAAPSAARVDVDWALCESNGFCTEVAPQVFRLDEADDLHVLVAEPDAAQLPGVQQAVHRCPRQAIRLSQP